MSERRRPRGAVSLRKILCDVEARQQHNMLRMFERFRRPHCATVYEKRIDVATSHRAKKAIELTRDDVLCHFVRLCHFGLSRIARGDANGLRDPGLGGPVCEPSEHRVVLLWLRNYGRGGLR
jgi:hypothetical protein